MPLWRGYGTIAAVMVVVSVALGIELGQVMLPEKYPDTTDWVLESLGGILGYVLVGMMRGRLLLSPRRQQPARKHG